MPTVTVLVPNYNHERFLRRRLESIFNQTFESFEVILMDDASTDNSKDIIEEYRNHPKLKRVLYNISNSGSPFRQWYRGIELATTDWIWIAESDDYCDERFLESFLPAFNDTNIVMAYAEISWVNETGDIIKAGQRLKPRIWDGRTFLEQKMVMEDYLVNSGMIIFRRTAVASIDRGWLGMRQAGDYWFWCELAAQGSVYACGRPLAFFTRHQNTVSSSLLYTPIHFEESLRVLDQMLRRGNVKNSAVRKYFLHQLLQLETGRKGMHSEEYETTYRFWIKAATERSLHFSSIEIVLKAYAAKAKHFIKRKLIFDRVLS